MKNTPNRHEVKSRLRTRVVIDKTKYIRNLSNRRDEAEIHQIFNDARRVEGNSEGNNFLITQNEYKGCKTKGL